MKKTILVMMALGCSLAAPVFGQSTKALAHWDFVDGATRSATFAPEDDHIDCIKPHNVTRYGLNYSWSTADSEDGSRFGANCFSGWDHGDYVAFGVTFANDAVGSVKAINFDIANYGDEDDPTHYAVGVYKNGSFQGLAGGWRQITARATSNSSGRAWSSSADQTLDVSYFNLKSEFGSEDKFQFRIFAKGGDDDDDGRIALDNFRVIGHADCVPEPSSAALLGLAGFAMLIRRKRA